MSDPSAVFRIRRFRGDLWQLHAVGLWVVDPTNAFVKRDGRNVMGRGISLQASTRLGGLDAWYGARLLAEVRPGRPAGEPVRPADLQAPALVIDEERRLLLTVVKYNWWERADLDLIAGGLGEISIWLLAHPDQKIALPRLGCGNGKRDWESEVKPLVRVFLEGLSEEDRRRVVLVEPA